MMTNSHRSGPLYVADVLLCVLECLVRRPKPGLLAILRGPAANPLKCSASSFMTVCFAIHLPSKKENRRSKPSLPPTEWEEGRRVRHHLVRISGILHRTSTHW